MKRRFFDENEFLTMINELKEGGLIHKYKKVFHNHLLDSFYKLILENKGIAYYRNDEKGIRANNRRLKRDLRRLKFNELVDEATKYYKKVNNIKKFLNRKKKVQEVLNKDYLDEEDIKKLINWLIKYKNASFFDEIFNKAKEITRKNTLSENIEELKKKIKNNIELKGGEYIIIPTEFSISSEIYSRDINPDEYKRLLKLYFNNQNIKKVINGNEIKIIDKEQILKNINNQNNDFYRIDKIELKEKDNYYDNEAGDCLEVAIKELTGKEFKSSNIIDYKDNDIGFYNKYGVLLKGNRFSNNNIILFNNHALAINKHISQRLKVNPNPIILEEWEAERLIALEKDKKIYFLYPSIVRGENDKILEFSAIIPNIFNELKGFKGFEAKDDKIMSYYVIYSLKSENKKIIENIDNLDDVKYIEGLKVPEFYIISGLGLEWIENFIKEEREKRKINKCIDEWEKFLNKHLSHDCFLENYRKRSICFSYVQDEKIHGEIDMKKAYLTSYKEMIKEGIYNVLPFPIKNYKHVKGKHFIFYASDCSPFKEGYYYGKYYEAFKEYNLVFYLIDEKIETKEMENIEIDDIYKKLIGKLIQTNNKFEYCEDNYINEGIVGLRFRHNKLSILHLNIMMKLNEIMLNKVLEIYKTYGEKPISYNVDSIIYKKFKGIEGDKFFKDEELKSFDFRQEGDKVEIEEKFIFGCAGCGKTYKIINEGGYSDLYIVNKHMLNNEVYRKNGLNAVIYEVLKNDYNYYNCSRIIVDEIFTFSIKEQCEIISLANYYNIPYVLVGDYNQLLPIREIRDRGVLREFEMEQVLKYCCDDYIYKNYRNNLNFEGSEHWIIKAINGLSHEEAINMNICGKMKNLYNKLIAEGKITFNEKIEGLRWYKETAKTQYDKIAKGEIKFDKYILNNVLDKNKIKSGKWKEIIFKAGISYDTFYTIEELKIMLKDNFKNCFKFFINLNCVSAYNTQGLSLNKINILNEKEGEAFLESYRMFYVLVSRLKD